MASWYVFQSHFNRNFFGRITKTSKIQVNNQTVVGTARLSHDTNLKKPLQLEALPHINQSKNGTIGNFEYT